MGFIHDIRTHRDLLMLLIGRNIKIRYKNSSLGFFWTLLSPLFLILIYSVFLKIMRFTMDLPLLVVGIIVWHFLSMCMGDALHAILGNVNMVKKSAFPRIILPLSMVIANLLNFLLSLAVVAGYLLVLHFGFNQPIRCHGLLWLPVVILTQWALCFGISTMVSACNVFFRDVEHIIGIALMAWFFMTPIIYPVTLVTERFNGPLLSLYFANPMTGIVTAYRSILLGTPAPGMEMIAITLVVAWAFMFIGIKVFQKVQIRFADVM